MKIRPLSGNVLVRLLPEKDQTDSGLFLPDIAMDSPHGEKKRPYKATVLEVGSWPLAKNGMLQMPQFRKGDTVIVSAYAGIVMGRNIGEHLRLIKNEDVLAVLSEA